MRQYLEVKTQHPDAILFFRVGDFHEMFFEDAVVAAKALDLTLTSRDKGHDEAVPMCGVPHHATRGYVARLTEMGHKVVLCEQTEDPKKAKGLVRREVVRVITPGVVLDDEVLDPKTARYVASVVPSGQRQPEEFGFAYLDASTGEFRATQLSAEGLIAEMARVLPNELLCSAELVAAGAPWLDAIRTRHPSLAVSTCAHALLDDAIAALESELPGCRDDLALAEVPLATRGAADVLLYARATQPTGFLPLTRLQMYRVDDAVVLDEAAVANLELVSTLIGANKKGALLSVIDKTATACGGRLLRRWLLYPLTDVATIRRRQDAVAHLVERSTIRAEVREALSRVADIERLAGRVALAAATPRDLGKLRDSLGELPAVVAILAREPSIAGGAPELLRFDTTLLQTLAEVQAELERALVDAPTANVRDGGIIREGFCDVVDESRRLADGGKDAILAIEAREREATGISNLKVKYNRVFGYFIEVTKSNLTRVPEQYVRKQTVATGERFVTAELADLESKILAAQERLLVREQELFDRLCKVVGAQMTSLLAGGKRVATIDTLAGLAELAHRSGYVRPEVDDGDVIDIKGGRHPVVETMVPLGDFVPNDCVLNPNCEQILLITGPNMAGKSTYMRQVAQIVLLAQIGSFVPAESAVVGVVDRIFTRVGAADNLARGESTFMVEMREAATILTGATKRSLVVLDEVGRGTSTYDGVSIAWAVTEYLHDAIGARTVFATHYHELCALAETRPRIRNVSVAVREHQGQIVFLRQVVPGGANRSYGIDVARLAGLPRSVIGRARQILTQLEQGLAIEASNQLALFAPAPRESADSELVQTLRGVDPNDITPMQALALIATLCDQVR